ncbi:tRNA lysidine(34) synthetase TilS [Malaciobacter mytili LMG 24559]|uniref:tRNA(Ile)-lysidine synthase n=1 Tax=Malaciobacter mytili LMG 24559 TaxID=1032238 RepID=A0AAX2AHX5_9BACT|nr:tRNA lysidine(34) synthetase TilS [Malaciobacter mytili]AXH16013.1 tRNA(Ile)-lysidine synthetase [Malaciobacter mytili LMG 24559]RXK15801.1 tRNA lysidine(34) synthetase TilS [Malaciobacter mytili LMG 24559]
MQLNLKKLNTSRNLLAFSAGVDSTALFFLLLENKIEFDIAIVNYNQREQSKKEVLYAKELAKKYNKKIFLKELEYEEISNFEKVARDIRYSFFENIIKEFSYETLITAHQLNDKLEWFFMQLSKGAGVFELLGLQEYQKREFYTISRPLLNISKEELESYLIENQIKYFIDNTNFDEKYKRNYFRHNFSDKFLQNFKQGVLRSFEYMQNDLDSLNIQLEPIYQKEQLFIFKNLKDKNLNIKVIDKCLKRVGILISKAQRDEILKQQQSVISNKFAICIQEKTIWICPYIKDTMSKKFKEECRVFKIPKLLRSYLFSKGIMPKEILKDLAIYF